MAKIADWQEEYGEPLAHSIIELRLDETHFDVAVESGTKPQVKDGKGRPVVQFKGTKVWKGHANGVPVHEEQPLVLPPAVLSQAANAQLLYAAVRSKLPASWDRLLRGCEILGIILGHDSHPANGRLFYGLVQVLDDRVIVPSCRCTMHQLQICIKDLYLLSFIRIHDPIFCMTKLLGLGRHADEFELQVKRLFFARFNLKHGKPDPLWRRFAELLLELIFYPAEAEDQRLEQKSEAARRKEGKALIDFCSVAMVREGLRSLVRLHVQLS
jgi:hypothetical protein